MCSRAPLVMTEDLLRDLAQYKNYRERSVMMAAKSLIHVYRCSMPHLLHKKDRVINFFFKIKLQINVELVIYDCYFQGRPTEAALEIVPKKYGEVDAKEFVSGAEVLLETESKETCDDSENSDEEWVDVSHSEDDLGDAECNESDGEEITSDEAYLNESDYSISSQIPSTLNQIKIKKIVTKKEQLIEKKEKAAQVSSTRILSDEDFKRIEIAQLSKQMTSAKNRKRPAEPDRTR